MQNTRHRRPISTIVKRNNQERRHFLQFGLFKMASKLSQLHYVTRFSINQQSRICEPLGQYPVASKGVSSVIFHYAAAAVIQKDWLIENKKIGIRSPGGRQQVPAKTICLCIQYLVCNACTLTRSTLKFAYLHSLLLILQA